jgi:hypothetical protein
MAALSKPTLAGATRFARSAQERAPDVTFPPPAGLVPHDRHAWSKTMESRAFLYIGGISAVFASAVIVPPSAGARDHPSPTATPGRCQRAD